MKVALIDCTNYIINYGLRVLAAYIYENGHDVKLTFLPPQVLDNSYNYPASLYSDLNHLLKDVELVGISFVSNYLGQARYLTEYIKKNLGIPVAWGGVHATGAPEESLNYADMVCLGEGEESLLALLNKMEAGIDYTDTKNFWFKRGSKIIKNGMFPLEGLDKYPFPLYDLEREFIREENNIVPMTYEKMKNLHSISNEYLGLSHELTYYLSLTSRGCPNSCTYCCNNLYKKLYKNNKNLLRRRSVPNIIGEFVNIMNKFPFINFFNIFDDDFCAAPKEFILEFSKEYKKQINFPFKCNVSPNSISPEKIQALVNAGLVSVEMGIQTASPRVNKEIYKRNISNEKVLHAAEILNKHTHIKTYYDFIFDNPLETVEDKIMTARFLAELPKPFGLSSFSLTLFPGTELHKEFKQKNMICDEIGQVYNKRNNKLYNKIDPYYKAIIRIALKLDHQNKLNTLLMNILASRLAFYLFNRKYFFYLYNFIRSLANRDKVE